MDKAPERIWAFPKKDWFNAGASTHPVTAAGAKDVPYIREDMSNALVAAAWHDGFAQGDTYARGMVGQPGPPDDPQAAYDVAIRAAKIEGMREALALVYHDNQKHPEDNRVWGEGGRPYVCEENLHERITALIEEAEKGGS